MYNCISILNETFDNTLPIWSDKTQIMNVTQKINVLYKEIKKNETISVKPVSARNNITNTFEKLEIMARHSNII